MTAIKRLAENERYAIHLFDLEERRFYVKLTSTAMTRVLSIIRSQQGNISAFSRKVQLPWQSFYNWVDRKEFPLFVLNIICKELKISRKYITSNVIHLKSGWYPTRGGNLSEPIKPKFPITVTKEFCRVLAHLFGDGMISVGKRGQINAAYFNQDSELINRFRKDIEKLFEVPMKKVPVKINKTTQFVQVPSPVGLIFLHQVKTFSSRTCRVPDFIKNGTRNIQKEFLRSFFDDEAYVKYKPPHRYIELTLANKLFLEDVKEILSKFGISSSRTYSKSQRGFAAFYFYIRGKANLLRYHNKIGFNHKQKKGRLFLITKDAGRPAYAHGETKEKIINLLKEEQIWSSQLAKKLKRKLCTINHFLKGLEQQGKIRCAGREKGYKLYKVVE